MANGPNSLYRRLSDRLGYAFNNEALLKIALTHSSARMGSKPGDDNERLEFLGDRVLGLAVAELLMNHFPEAYEGELAPYYNQLVRAETCADVAVEWGLAEFISIGSGKPGSGMLGNACEAILGAVFVDGGYENARAVVYRFWMQRLDDLELSAPNAKSVLQEWAQGRRLPLPLYLELAREGPDHEPRFTVEVQIEGIAAERGQGANKRAAEQAAACRMLLREGVWTEPENA
ncbi:MAG TPA: ribonuclease III [Methyloceanibacter sp.]